MSQPIFTINARGNTMLEVVQSYFGLDQLQMFREINGTFAGLLQILEIKGINYASLKHALVPCPDRNEIALIFDSKKIQSGWYGRDVFDRLLPALDRSGTHSVLCGDLIDKNDIQDRLYAEFSKRVDFARSCDWNHSSQFFIVYVNNLSDQMVSELRSPLLPYEAYVGFLDCNLPSFFKTYFSMILCNCFLKVGQTIIQGHEDDRENTEDINMLGYPFEKYGYTCKSFQSIFYDLFLNYKIECAVYPGFESDTLFSLNSISNTVVPLEDCEVQVEELKLQYLVEKKQGSLKKAGMVSITKGELEVKIRERLANNYIFNMSYLEAHETMKFNTVLNFFAEDTGRLVKLTAALEYKPAEKRLRLITMF
jgi:hypothetical protein